MFCDNCGNRLEFDAKFCPNCGNKVTKKNIGADSDIEHLASDERFNLLDHQPKASSKMYIMVSALITIAILLPIVTFINEKNADPTPKTTQSVSQKKVTDIVIDSASDNDVKNKETKDSPKAAESVPVETDDVQEETVNDEYLFPYSNSEYLTDLDIETLSYNELALARNEIIARHGRIFTTEAYKTYFESKSWYSGTIEPDIFDLNYDNELNEIEKANIALIKKHEEKINETNADTSIAFAEFTKEYYGDFLEGYRNQEAQGFPIQDVELINRIFLDPLYFPNGYSQSGMALYYTVIDLANDGVPELFISDGEIIYGAYGLWEPDYQIFPLLDTGGAYLGDRMRCYICNDGIIKEESSSGASESATKFYRLEKNSIDLTLIEGGCISENLYYRIFSGGLETEEITLSHYDSILSQFSLKQDIQWIKLSEFQM